MAGSRKTIEEYLVSLGFEIDNPAYQRYQQALQRIEQSAGKTDGVLGKLGKTAFGISGALAAAVSGAVMLVKKIADADQQYRLYARRRYMSFEEGKRQMIAMQALGNPDEDLMFFDPELRSRFRRMVDLQKQLHSTPAEFAEYQKKVSADRAKEDAEREAKAGANPANAGLSETENQLRKVRDIEEAYHRVAIVGKYAIEDMVVNGVRRMSPEIDSLIGKLGHLESWYMKNREHIVSAGGHALSEIPTGAKIAGAAGFAGLALTAGVLIKKYGSSVMGRFSGVGAGVVAGEVLQKTIGVTPVFVVNQPTNLLDKIASKWSLSSLLGIALPVAATAAAVVTVGTAGKAAWDAAHGGSGKNWISEGAKDIARGWYGNALYDLVHGDTPSIIPEANAAMIPKVNSAKAPKGADWKTILGSDYRENRKVKFDTQNGQPEVGVIVNNRIFLDNGGELKISRTVTSKQVTFQPQPVQP
jgi:hypothetical protein